jgi:hypothetical protein
LPFFSSDIMLSFVGEEEEEEDKYGFLLEE